VTPVVVGTPLSHYTRKVRVLLAELGVEHVFDVMRARSVLSADLATYAGNPLRRVPALLLGDELVIDSDHIARVVVERFDPQDRLGVRSGRVEDLNRLAVIDGVMANEVTLLLAARAGTDLATVPYFAKLRAALEDGLAHLDATVASGEFDYRDVALVCMWQHLEHYKFLPLPYPRLAARVARFADRPSVASTTPAASLAAATAAGWSPSG
jgi:glutathione S-transferase